MSSPQGLSPRMIGRTDDLDGLVGGLDGRGGVALVGGDAGIGKSRLMRELAERLPCDIVVRTARAEAGGLGRPFEMFGQLVADQGELPEGLRASGPDAPSLADRLVLASALLDVTTDGEPTVLVFEDLHWADSETVALFELLVAAGGRSVVGTYRPGDLHRKHPFVEVIDRLTRRPEAVIARLVPLDQDEVGRFVGAVYGRDAPPRVIDELHARTGGNPYFLEELLKAAPGGVEDLAEVPLPWSLADLVHGQIDRLDDGDRRVVEVAAILGRRVGFDAIAGVTGLDEDELIGHLRRLIGTGLLTETTPDVFEFRHDLTREAVAARLLGREQRRVHRAAFELFRDDPNADAASVVRHAKAAGLTTELVDLARDAAARYLASASVFQALELAELGLETAPRDLPMRLLAVQAASLAGLLDDAVGHGRQMVAHARSAGDAAAVAHAHRLLVRLYFDLDRPEDVRATVDALTADLETLEDTPEAARIEAVLAQEAMLNGRVGDVERWAELALASAERFGLPDVRRAARHELAASRVLSGDRQPSVEELRSVGEEAAAAGELALAVRAFSNAFFNSAGIQDRNVRRELLERVRSNAERVGWDGEVVGTYVQGRIALGIADGDLDEATRWAEQPEPPGTPRSSFGWVSLYRAALCLERGEVSEARRLLDALPEPTADKREYAAALRVAIAVAGRARRDVRAALDALREEAALDGLDLASLFVLLPHLGAPGLSADVVRSFASAAKRFHSATGPMVGPAKAALLGIAAGLDGQHEEALATLAPLVSIDAALWPIDPADAAVIHTALARSALQLRVTDLARTHAVEAARLLERWPGVRRETLAMIERRLGVVAARQEGSGELTPREREVLALVADGKTNADIADALFISPRTAAVHVSNILAKLDVATRTAAAAWFRDEA